MTSGNLCNVNNYTGNLHSISTRNLGLQTEMSSFNEFSRNFPQKCLTNKRKCLWNKNNEKTMLASTKTTIPGEW